LLVLIISVVYTKTIFCLKITVKVVLEQVNISTNCGKAITSKTEEDVYVSHDYKKYTEPVVLGAAIFIFSHLVCYERPNLHRPLAKTQSANVHPSSSWPAAGQKRTPDQ